MLRVSGKGALFMSDTQGNSSRPPDPLEPFRAVRDAYLDALAKSMVEAVNTEAYAEATGAVLDNCLSASAPFREALDKSMSQSLQQLSLPSRQEVAALAERFTNVEMRLDDMDAKLDAIVRSLGSGPAVRETRPHEPKPREPAAPNLGGKAEGETRAKAKPANRIKVRRIVRRRDTGGPQR